MKLNKIIYGILVVIWMITVFMFSHQQSEESSATSGNTIRFIINNIPIVKNYTNEQKEQIIEIMQPIVRKLAHFTIYTIGGILIALFINEFNITDNKKIIFSCLSGCIYSISDEIHQLFVPGRAGMIQDVIIDTLGVILGVALVWTVQNIRKEVMTNEKHTIFTSRHK